MWAKNFFDNYLQYYLKNSERKNLSRRFYASILLIALLNIYLSSNPSNLLMSMVAGGAVSLFMLIISFYFGYLGMIANVLFGIYAVARTLFLWSVDRKEFFLVIATFQIAVMGASFFIAYLCERERSKQRKLEWLSTTDGLTEVYNHRFFQQRLQIEMERALESGQPLAMAMIDIDNFKKYNDTMGHNAGDVILKQTADYLKKNVKEGDLVFRYGGDEFAVLITNFDKDRDTERYRQIIKSYGEFAVTAENPQLTNCLTLSMGFAVFPDNAGSKSELIKQADSALYMAKNAGRNRIQFYRDALEELRQMLTANEQQILSNLRVLLATVSVKDKYTLGHSERVSVYVFKICKALGLTEEEIKMNQLAALLHDIGKIEIPESILNKRGQLSSEEMESIREHPVYSAAILEPLKEINGIIPSVRYHHERFDGSGYPDGLVGECIPLGARILSVADAFDAMLSDRPYRKGMTLLEAVQQLVEFSGTQFDPEIVKAFIPTIDQPAGIEYTIG